jgi:hypothetical protein
MTSMSRKFYKALAAKYAKLRPVPTDSAPAYEMWEAMVIGTVNCIAEGNPSFDRARFLDACGHDPSMWWEAHREAHRSAALSR